MRNRRHRCTTLILFALASSPLHAGDWPQILGPNRNGVSASEQLAVWQGRPKQLWQKDVGSGWAGPAVQGEQVVLFHRVGRREVVTCFHAATGKELWKQSYLATYQGGINPDTGPRCVPVIQKGKVYVFGAAGDVHALHLSNGKKIWSRQAFQDYSGREGYFGAGSSPIVVNNLLIVNVGGRPSAGIVAFRLSDGKTKWKATDEAASYSSPTVTKVGGKTVVICVTRLTTLGLDPANGKVLFKMRFGRPGPTVNAATPIVFNNRLFLTASYGIGCVAAKLSLTSAPQVIWRNDETMSSQYTTCVYRGGFLYGTHGRQDIGLAQLRCIDARTGDVKWSVENFGVAHTILGKKRMLVLTDRGKLLLIDPSPRGYKKLAEAEVSSGTTRALPALSNGRLFFRVNGGRGTLIALQVGK